jgi:hypothetical protein
VIGCTGKSKSDTCKCLKGGGIVKPCMWERRQQGKSISHERQ